MKNLGINYSLLRRLFKIGSLRTSLSSFKKRVNEIVIIAQYIFFQLRTLAIISIVKYSPSYFEINNGVLYRDLILAQVNYSRYMIRSRKHLHPLSTVL